jgi:hypothetical protein
MDIEPRRARLTAIVRGVPPPIPHLDGENEIEGRVYQSLGFGILRVEIAGKLPEVFK